MLVGTTAWHSRKPSLLPTEDPTLGWSATRWLDSCSTCAMLSTPLRLVLVAALALSLPPLAVACSDDTSSSPSVSSAGSAGSAGTGGAGGQNGGAAGLGGAGGVPGVGAITGWLAFAAGSAVVGLLVGAVIVGLLHLVRKLRGGAGH